MFFRRRKFNQSIQDSFKCSDFEEPLPDLVVEPVQSAKVIHNFHNYWKFIKNQPLPPWIEEIVLKNISTSSNESQESSSTSLSRDSPM